MKLLLPVFGSVPPFRSSIFLVFFLPFEGFGRCCCCWCCCSSLVLCFLRFLYRSVFYNILYDFTFYSTDFSMWADCTSGCWTKTDWGQEYNEDLEGQLCFPFCTVSITTGYCRSASICPTLSGCQSCVSCRLYNFFYFGSLSPPNTTLSTSKSLFLPHTVQ